MKFFGPDTMFEKLSGVVVGATTVAINMPFLDHAINLISALVGLLLLIGQFLLVVKKHIKENRRMKREAKEFRRRHGIKNKEGYEQ